MIPLKLGAGQKSGSRGTSVEPLPRPVAAKRYRPPDTCGKSCRPGLGSAPFQDKCRPGASYKAAVKYIKYIKYINLTSTFLQTRPFCVTRLLKIPRCAPRLPTATYIRERRSNEVHLARRHAWHYAKTNLIFRLIAEPRGKPPRPSSRCYSDIMHRGGRDFLFLFYDGACEIYVQYVAHRSGRRGAPQR